MYRDRYRSPVRSPPMSYSLRKRQSFEKDFSPDVYSRHRKPLYRSRSRSPLPRRTPPLRGASRSPIRDRFGREDAKYLDRDRDRDRDYRLGDRDPRGGRDRRYDDRDRYDEARAMHRDRLDRLDDRAAGRLDHRYYESRAYFRGRSPREYSRSTYSRYDDRDYYRKRSPPLRRRSPLRMSKSPPRRCYEDDRRLNPGPRNHARGGSSWSERRHNPPQRTRYSLLLSNLDRSVNWMDLKDLSRQFGDVTFADANKIRVGEGIVTFSDRESMCKAHKSLQGIELRGCKMEVDYEFPELADQDIKSGSILNNNPPREGVGKDGLNSNDQNGSGRAGYERAGSRSGSESEGSKRSRGRQTSESDIE